MAYYKYSINSSYSTFDSYIKGECVFFNSYYTSACHGTCKSVVERSPSTRGYADVKGGAIAYCTQQQTDSMFTRYGSFDGEYIVSDFNNICTYDSYSNWNDCIEPQNVKISKVPVSSSQVQSMGTAFTTAGSGFLHIGIQLLPYAISFTVILIIFGLVKNWSRLKADWQLRRIHRNKTRKERAEIIGKTHYDNFSNGPTIYKD